MIEDDLSVYRKGFDGVGRGIKSTDPEGNTVETQFDDNYNVVKTTVSEITQRADAQSGKVPDMRETFTTISVFDALNRRIRTTDNLGQTSRYQYDSRRNLIFTSDAQYSKDASDLIPDPLGLYPNSAALASTSAQTEGWLLQVFQALFGWLQATPVHARGQSGTQPEAPARINRPGNTTEYFYDGINRRIAEVKHLRLDGQGRNPLDTSSHANPDGKITLMTNWDTNSRVVSRVDDNGNITRYQYDDLNRRLKEEYADGTTRVFTYDADDNIIQGIDENGSAAAAQYDGVNRPIRVDIATAQGVIGTTQQLRQYDGLSRVTQAVDNNDPADLGDDVLVTRAYDALGRLLEEVQNGEPVSSQWGGDSKRRLSLIYPSGRVIELTYDKLDRIDTIKDTRATAHVADYDYIGPSRILERIYSNGVRLTYLNDQRTQDVGYDRLRRIVNQRYLGQADHLVAGFVYEYDRQNNKLSEIKLHQQNVQERYVYDALYRLTDFARDGEDPDAFQLDGAGNWVSHNGIENKVNNMNEYELFADRRQLYDENGNLTDDGVHKFEYDALNRLRKVARKSDDALIAVYSYDAFGRRVSRLVTNAGEFNEHVRYFYDGWREIEERRDSSTQQYVYGLMLDEPLTLDRDRNKDGDLDETFFYHADAKGYITALTDTRGIVVERYVYDAYGTVQILDANGNALQRSSAGNPYLFAGRRLDPETGLYYFRTRYLNPKTGRFIQRDTLGLWVDPANLGNAYTYVGNSPSNKLDPLGLKAVRTGSTSPGVQCRPKDRETYEEGEGGGGERCDGPPGCTFGTNWCGPGCPNPIDPKICTKSCADEVCMRHDLCYAANGVEWYSLLDWCRTQCDAIACKEFASCGFPSLASLAYGLPACLVSVPLGSILSGLDLAGRIILGWSCNSWKDWSPSKPKGGKPLCPKPPGGCPKDENGESLVWSETLCKCVPPVSEGGGGPTPGGSPASSFSP